MEEKELVAIISVERIFFPKRRTHIKSNEFGIFVANIEEGISNCETLGKQIKLKGVGCERSIGSEKYKCTFKLADTNEKYGDTYEIIYINRLIDLKDTVKQHNLLMSILNENVVNRLFETYDNVIELLENEDVKSLVKVKGIGVQSAMKLIQKYKDCKDYSSIYTELGHLGLSSNLIKRLVDFYKSPDVVIETVNTNPYDLVRVDGIGFKKADEIAEKVGISGSNPNRVKGCLLYILSIGGESGKSYLHYSDLLKQLNDTIGYVEQDIINSVAKSLIDKKEVYISSNGEFVGLYKYRKLEEDIANELIRLLKAEPKVIINKQMFNKIIESTETEQGFNFTEEQKKAIEIFVNNNIIALTGGAGCGKTVTMRGMLNLVKQYSCVGCSLSGKASVRIKEGTGMDSMTIHRLLGYSFGGFSFDENNNLPYDVYFMDEATMTSGELFLSFLKAIHSGSKVVFTGDIQQLTPIGSCQVFGDILNSKVIPSARLTKPHRQALKSGIIPLSMNVINQERFCDSTFEGKQILGELQDMELDVFKDDLTPSKRVVKHYLEQYKIENNLMEVQVVVPMKNRGNMCTYNLNIEIQKEINPINPNRKQLIVNLDKERFYTIQVGDKVINTKNNYKAKTEDGDDIAVFNGNMGIVKDISDGYITINFDGIGNVVLDSVGSKALELGYACTVHKCLPKNTWIYTENGLKQLKHFDNGARVGEFKSLNDDVIKVYNGNYLEKPSHFYNNGMADCKELITKRGYKLTGTLEHGIDVLIETGETVRKNIKDIKENDYVIINKNINVYGNNIDLNLKEPVEYYNAKKYKLPTIITEDFSEFLGLMYGDGVITSCGIALGKEHKEVVDRFCELVNIIFGYKGTVKKLSHTNMYKCEICSTYIRDICKQIKELTPNNKTIPTIILSSNKENQCAFLRGVFEDGYVRLKNGRFDYIELSQKEYKNIEIIRLMLLNLGIISTTKTYKSNKGYINTRLYIYRKHAKIFKNNIGFITKEKNNRLALCEINYNHTCSNLKYPYITNIINNMINKYNIVFNDNKFKCNIKYSINTNSITDDLLEKFLNYISNTLSNTKEYIYLNDLYNNCFIDCITKIKNTKEYTYCLTMPETHKFVQNGIQGWNCQGSQFNRLIFAINSSDYVLLNAELGYTGITRASKYCIFVFKQQALNTMLNKREIKNKQTYLTIILQEKLLKNN